MCGGGTTVSASQAPWHPHQSAQNDLGAALSASVWLVDKVVHGKVRTSTSRRKSLLPACHFLRMGVSKGLGYLHGDRAIGKQPGLYHWQSTTSEKTGNGWKEGRGDRGDCKGSRHDTAQKRGLRPAVLTCHFITAPHKGGACLRGHNTVDYSLLALTSCFHSKVGPFLKTGRTKEENTPDVQDMYSTGPGLG